MGKGLRMGLTARDNTEIQLIHGRAVREHPDAPGEQIAARPSRSPLIDLAEEHAILANIASNLRSGFILINQAETIAYANPIAQRLLDIEQSAG